MITRLLAKTFILLITVVCFTSCGVGVDDIIGCMDSTATNYNPDANVDSGDCIYAIIGCTDPDAINFDPDATVDSGDCAYEISGCTDPTALNYNPEATVDSGDCAYEISGCTDPTALNYIPDATSDDGSCTYPKDLFIGNFRGSNLCTGLLEVINTPDPNFTYAITEDPMGSLEKVRVLFTSGPLPPVYIPATINDKNISLEETEFPYIILQRNVTLEISGGGYLSADETEMDLVLNVYIIEDATGFQLSWEACDIVGIRQ